LGELHKDWTEAGVSASGATTHRRIQDMGYNCRITRVKLLLNNIRSVLPGLRRKITFQMKVNFAFHLEIKVPESGGRVERHRIKVA